MQLGLHLVHRVLETPVPAEVLADGDRDPEVAALVGVVRGGFRGAAAATPQHHVWDRTVRSVWFRAMERWSDRLRQLYEWTLMPQATDWEWLPLPAWAAPAYYAVRPLRLMLKHGFGLGAGTGPPGRQDLS
jgi:hypothetical protein